MCCNNILEQYSSTLALIFDIKLVQKYFLPYGKLKKRVWLNFKHLKRVVAKITRQQYVTADKQTVKGKIVHPNSLSDRGYKKCITGLHFFHLFHNLYHPHIHIFAEHLLTDLVKLERNPNVVTLCYITNKI